MVKFTSSSKLSHGTDVGLEGQNSFLSQIKGVLVLGVVVIVLAVMWTILATPQLRGWGLLALATIVALSVLWTRRRNANRPSLDETLSDLGEDQGPRT
jgi:4-amino-4-deoxy-L-arabinose transferase-like glycosyltransferase